MTITAHNAGIIGQRNHIAARDIEPRGWMRVAVTSLIL